MSQPTENIKEMSFVEHLEELRWHIIRALVGILIITIITFISHKFVFDVLILSPKNADFFTYIGFCKLSNLLQLGDMLCIKPKDFDIINIQMMSQFLIHIKVSVVLGFIIAFPYVFWEIWRFIEPGLSNVERKYSGGVVAISSLLFFIGILFGYFILTPFSINFFASYSISPNVTNQIALDSYISVITTLVLASGIMFELPMVVYFLSKVGLLTPDFMREHRRHALVVIIIIAAIITPADVWTQILVSIPVYFLYELSIFVSARVVRKAALAETLPTVVD